jgi:riboflavin kinase/FMN adenylyltransferase
MIDFGCEIPKNVPGGYVSIGNFDGVHRGHKALVDALCQHARSLGTHTVAVTFHPHPVAVLRPSETPPLLTTPEDRVRLLKQSGVDHVLVLPVNSQLLSVSAGNFFSDFVVRQLDARGMVEGQNFRFGHGRQGNITVLQQMCQTAGISLHIEEMTQQQGLEISSSRIRTLIADGKIGDAVQLLGHPFRLTGTVQPGAGRGATIGFPTANLHSIETQLPEHGVYAGGCRLGGRTWVAAVSIGPNPTFQDGRVKVECYLDEFSGTLYGQTVSVDLVSEIRPLRKFDGIQSLVNQIRLDVGECRRIMKNSGQTWFDNRSLQQNIP